MVNPDEDILQQLTQEEPSESPLTLLAANTTTASDAPSGSLNAYRASGASVQPAKDPTEVFKQLHPEAATRIQRFFELADERGLGLKPGSMNRDYGTQAKMYADKQAGLRGAYQNLPVSPPGSSTHMGFATDFSGYKPEKLQAIRELAKEVGLVYGGNWSGKTFDPVHIQLGPGSDVTRYIQGHIDPKAGTVNWEGVRSTQLPEDFIARAIAAAQGQNVPVKEVKVEGAPNATGSVTAAAEPDPRVEEADVKVEVTKKRSKDIDLAKLIKMLDDSTSNSGDMLRNVMQSNAQRQQEQRSRTLSQIAQFDQEQVNKMAEALKSGKPQSYKEGGEFEEGEDTPNLDKLISDLMKQRTTEAEIIDNGFKPRDYDPAKITQALSIISGRAKDPSTELQMQYMLGKLGLNAGVLQSDKYRGYNAGVNIPLSDTSSVNLSGNYGRVMGAYGQEAPASWGVRGSYVKRFAEGGPKLPDRPEYEMTDNSDAVDMTPAGPWERTFQKVTGGRNLQNDLSNIQSRLPTMEDYGKALLHQRDVAQETSELGRHNLREGYTNRDLPQMLLGTGQGVMGLVSPAMTPINAGLDVFVNTAGKFDPRAKAEAELLGLVGTEGTGAAHGSLKTLGDAVVKASERVKLPEASLIALPAAVAAAERPAEAATRSLSPVGLYSHAAEMAEALPQAKGTPEQMRAMLFDKYGVKPAELEGFEEKFFGSPSVTKEELATHFRERMPQVEETILGGKQPFDVNRLKELEKEYAGLKQHPIDDPLFGEDKYNEMIRLMNIRDQSSTQSLYDAADQAMRNGQRAQSQGHKITAEKYFRESEFLNTRAEKLDLEDMGLASPTKYSDRTLPGGENYREVLLKLPYEKKEQDKSGSLLYRNSMPEYKPPEFQSTHWNEPNVLAHIRMSDRTGPNGEKLLHVEEMQSDWGQKGRKEGFVDPQIKLNYDKHIKELDLAQKETENLMKIASDRLGQANPRFEDAIRVVPELKIASDKQSNLYYNIPANPATSGVPTAPYVTSTQGWTDLALKRVLKEAAEGGYDGIVFTPGAEQAKRYDLSQQIDELAHWRSGDEIGLSASGPEGTVLDQHYVSKEKLPSVVGKELAEKILNGEGSSKSVTGYPEEKGVNFISGEGLSVGGEGMKGYYDKIVPTQLQKLVKGYDKDAKLGTMRTNSLPDMLHMPVTDKMREHILKGQKAYMRGGRVGYADGGLVADNGQSPDGTGRQQYDAYGNVSDSQGGPVHAVQYDPDRINMMAQQLHEGTYG